MSDLKNFWAGLKGTETNYDPAISEIVHFCKCSRPRMYITVFKYFKRALWKNSDHYHFNTLVGHLHGEKSNGNCYMRRKKDIQILKVSLAVIVLIIKNHDGFKI